VGDRDDTTRTVLEAGGDVGRADRRDHQYVDHGRS
jgi:hypothetical protein